MLATQCAEYFDIPPQREGESDHDFRYRVAGNLRERGKIIESHEAFNDKLYNEDDNVMTGIIGALAFAYHGKSFNGDPINPNNGQRQIDDDFAQGILVQNPKPKMSPEMALLSVELFGRR